MSPAGEGIVAIVDDDNRVLESLADLLESAGYQVRVFPSAQSLLNSDALHSVDCVVSDIRMPDMDGWQLDAAVARMRADLPVILMTAHEESRTSQLLKGSGRALTVLRKPFPGHQLIASIRAVLAPGRDPANGPC